MAFFITTPCPKQLADMAETAEGWHCASCNRTVVDLTNATEADVAQKLAQGPVCGEVRTTSTGRLLLAGETASGVGDPAQVTTDSPRPPGPTFDTNHPKHAAGWRGSGASQTRTTADRTTKNGPVSEPSLLTFVWSGRTSSAHNWTALRTWDVQKSAGQAREERLVRHTQRKARHAKHAAADMDPMADKQ